ncbi:MAG: hypothetical protein EOM20_05920 [Spartobacteria bacterium]|nr:hypothetical protein [Spartobacteria bacterium]
MHMTTLQEVRSEVMALPAEERASLAHDLIRSLDEPEKLELSSEYESEIERRVEMVREGSAVGRPSEDVFSDIKAKYQ